jgi:hypothetical protein
LPAARYTAEQHIAAAAKQAALRQLAELAALTEQMRPKTSAVSAALVELAVSAPWTASNF